MRSRLLREQAGRTPPPQWVRVVGGWTEFQFKERRMPTLEEINAAAPDTPVFVLHLYDRAWLNGAALRAVGYTKDTPDPPGGEIERDRRATPRACSSRGPTRAILYSTLAKGPKLGFEDQLNSTRRFMRELNRLGRDERDRRRRRLPELPRRLRGHRGAAPGRASSRCGSPTTSSRSGRRRSWTTSALGGDGEAATAATTSTA